MEIPEDIRSAVETVVRSWYDDEKIRDVNVESWVDDIGDDCPEGACVRGPRHEAGGSRTHVGGACSQDNERSHGGR